MPARHAYHDDGIYQDELVRLFAARLFIGMAAEFAAPDSYRSFRLGRHALTCRATTDGVRAYGNVCLHRNALIDPPGTGRRPFRCGYHGWQYQVDGELEHAPLTDPACLRVRRLSCHPVAAAGPLYFAGLHGVVPEVDEVPGLLDQVSVVPAEPFHQGELAHECNWKLLVENVLEGYHLDTVHESSLAATGFDTTTTAEVGEGSYTSWSRALPSAAPLVAALKHFPGARHQYLHGYVFPNLFMANTNNLVGYLGELLPLSAERTLLRWRLFELPALLALPANVREQVRRDAAAVAVKVLQEDRPMVESCQHGMAALGPAPQLQPCERRIAHFHQMYAERMEASAGRAAS